MIGLIAVSFFFMIFLGFPIAMAMACTTMVAIIADPSVNALVFCQKAFSGADSFALLAVPFFMLCGNLMSYVGIVDVLVNFANTLIGWVRGGLAHAVIVAGALMAAITGSANASAAAIGSISTGALRKEGYSGGMAVSIVAAAGGLGPIIPPSIAMVIYCNLTNMSVGKMFVAGYIPGIILAVGYCVFASIFAKKHGLPKHQFAGVKTAAKVTLQTIPALVLPVIIIGGILFGVFTATEAGVIGAVYGIAYGVVTRKLTLANFWKCMKDSVLGAAGPMAIIIMSNGLGYMFTRNGLSAILADFFAGTGSYVVFYIMIVIILLIAGMFIDGTASMLILVPILIPIAKDFGLDMMQFSMIFILALLTGGLTPPVGALLFIVSGTAKVPLKECCIPVIPFVVLQCLLCIVIIFVPEIVTVIPELFAASK